MLQSPNDHYQIVVENKPKSETRRVWVGDEIMLLRSPCIGQKRKVLAVLEKDQSSDFLFWIQINDPQCGRKTTRTIRSDCVAFGGPIGAWIITSDCSWRRVRMYDKVTVDSECSLISPHRFTTQSPWYVDKYYENKILKVIGIKIVQNVGKTYGLSLTVQEHQLFDSIHEFEQVPTDKTFDIRSEFVVYDINCNKTKWTDSDGNAQIQPLLTLDHIHQTQDYQETGHGAAYVGDTSNIPMSVNNSGTTYSMSISNPHLFDHTYDAMSKLFYDVDWVRNKYSRNDRYNVCKNHVNAMLFVGGPVMEHVCNPAAMAMGMGVVSFPSNSNNDSNKSQSKASSPDITIQTSSKLKTKSRVPQNDGAWDDNDTNMVYKRLPQVDGPLSDPTIVISNLDDDDLDVSDSDSMDSEDEEEDIDVTENDNTISSRATITQTSSSSSSSSSHSLSELNDALNNSAILVHSPLQWRDPLLLNLNDANDNNNDSVMAEEDNVNEDNNDEDDGDGDSYVGLSPSLSAIPEGNEDDADDDVNDDNDGYDNQGDMNMNDELSSTEEKYNHDSSEIAHRAGLNSLPAVMEVDSEEDDVIDCNEDDDLDQYLSGEARFGQYSAAGVNVEVSKQCS